MKKERISFRIQFDKGVVQYLEDYKRDNNVSVQKFVEQAVEEKIKKNQQVYDDSISREGLNEMMVLFRKK